MIYSRGTHIDDKNHLYGTDAAAALKMNKLERTVVSNVKQEKWNALVVQENQSTDTRQNDTPPIMSARSTERTTEIQPAQKLMPVIPICFFYATVVLLYELFWLSNHEAAVVINVATKTTTKATTPIKSVVYCMYIEGIAGYLVHCTRRKDFILSGLFQCQSDGTIGSSRTTCVFTTDKSDDDDDNNDDGDNNNKERSLRLFGQFLKLRVRYEQYLLLVLKSMDYLLSAKQILQDKHSNF